jgi:tRNA 2-selenouridine synthase
MQRQIPARPIAEVLSHKDSFDCLIDVRSPAEFQDDHIPGAINLPVLNDEERAEVGTLYKQVDPFAARKLGASLTSANIARHLEYLAHHDRDWRPLVYCWRGGQRSGSLALVLNEIGWPVTLLQGGYKAYRREVQSGLSEHLTRLDLRVLAGPTGCGKTAILKQMADAGYQVLDLEALAQHRGSLLGAEPDLPQPSQKYFDSLLFEALCQMRSDQPVWVESESSKIGEIHLPKALFARLTQAPALALECPAKARAEFSLATYQHLTVDPDRTLELIDKLAFRHSKEQLNLWRTQLAAEDWFSLCESLLTQHYDPAYQRSQKRLQIKTHYELEGPGHLEPGLKRHLEADF